MTKRVHSVLEDLHLYTEEPEWYQKTRYEGNVHCTMENCHRFIELTCRRCKFTPYTTLKDKYGPFVNVILCLVRKGIPKDLVVWITKQYIHVPIKTTLTCPYVKMGNDVYHKHCVEDRFYYRRVHEVVNGEMALFEMK